MKVIFVIVSMAGGGAERVISILANQFVQNHIEVTILMTAGDTVAYQLDSRIRLRSAGGVTGGSMKARLKRIAAMRACFKENRDSVIISFGPGTSFFAVAADLFLGHHFIISERNDPAACEHPILRNIIYSRAKHLVFQTKEAMQCFPGSLQRKGCVIPNPISSELPEAYTGVRQKSVVAVGRLEPQKNHALLLHAFAQFHEKYPEYVLRLLGDGSLKASLVQKTAELGIDDYVIFEGFVKDVPERIREAGMYVLSSDYEGISNSLLEAMALGLPSISTDCPIGGSALCINQGENGLLVPVGDADALERTMCQIAADEKFANSLSVNAAGIREAYSEKNIGKAWEALLYENHVCGA